MELKGSTWKELSLGTKFRNTPCFFNQNSKKEE